MTAFNPINYVGFQNPVAAIKLQQQQELAKKLLEQGDQQDNTNQLANPGGLMIPYSPWQGLAKAGEKISGAYLQNSANEKLAKALQGSTPNLSGVAPPEAMDSATDLAIGQGEGPATQDSVNQKLAAMLQGSSQGGSGNLMKYGMADSIASGLGKAMFEQDQKKQNLTDEAGLRTYSDAQGVTHMVKDMMGDATKAPASPWNIPNTRGAVSPLPNQVQAGTPAGDKAITEVFGGNDTPAKPVVLDTDKSDVAMASDDKPLLPDLKSIPAPDPTGTPKFKTENTKTGVEQTIQDQKDAAEGNKAFAATAQSLGQEKSRLDNLIQVYKDVQSGTLTAQNPELFNKLAALGFRDDPASIKDLAGVQNATQNHILQVIQQIKDTNANAGGGAPTRVFGSEISQLLENGESAKGQPEALWNVIGQAKGVVDHHLDMVNGWQKVGGLGNRLAAGYTMRPDDFASQFTTSHNISDYRDKALKEIGPFKGMAGNNGGAKRISVIAPNGKAGTIDESHLDDLIAAGGKVAK